MEEWKEYKLEETTDFIAGYAFKSKDFGSYENKVVKIKDIQPPFVSIASIDGVNIHEYDISKLAKYLVYKNDFLLAMTGATIGKIGRYIYDKPVYLNQRILKFMPKVGFDSDFIYYSLISDSFQKFIINHIDSDSAQPNISANTIGKYRLYIPDITIQKKISHVLKVLDSKIELNRRINDNLEQQAQALFKSWFVDFEPFNGEKPSNWSYCKIKNLHHIIETGKRPKGGVAHIKQGIPSIGAESIKGIGYYDYSKTKYISNEFASSLKKGKIHDYDLLIYKDGGKPGYFIPNFSIMGEGFPFDTMYLNEHVFRLDLGSSGMNIFAYFYFQTDEIINMLESVGGKAAIPGINQQNIEDLEILSPDIDYVQRYGELVYPIFKSILQNCRENAKLEKIRDALLPRLMSGELKIYDLNC